MVEVGGLVGVKAYFREDDCRDWTVKIPIILGR